MKTHNTRIVLFIELFISVLCLLSYCTLSVGAPEDWMPDPNLRRVVSETLDVESLTIADMQRLHDLVSNGDGVESLEGLQHAVNLKFLQVNKSQISDLTPLAGLVNLNTLKLDHNPISDLTPLAELMNLEWLQLHDCQISDLTPLAGLVNLRWLFLQYNQISDITPIRNLTKLEQLEIIGNPIDTHAVGAPADWMPDPNLEQAVREELEIPDIIPIHPGDVTRLHELHLIGLDIRSLKGLEYAVNLKFLAIARTQILDLTPLTGLENLRVLKLNNNRISDIAPLANLIDLEVLQLSNNQISDISSLAGLVNLKELSVGGNQIVDFTPIYGLVGIETLRLGDIPRDSEALEILNPVDRHTVCSIEGVPIHPRIENREYPSVFQTGQGIINLPMIPWEERMTYHDLFFRRYTFELTWETTPDGMKLIGDLEASRGVRDRNLARNPNFILLTSIEYYVVKFDEYPEDWPYFFRDESGNRLEDQGWDQWVIDFTHPAVQEMVIQQAIEVAKCGTFDGIHMDHWNKGHTFKGYRTLEEEHTARDHIIKGIREAVDDDFLILVTVTDTTIPRHAEYINGLFMETTDDWTPEGGYTYEGLAHIENTLLWAEENLREPQINCLAGRGVRNEPLDSPRNLQWMRLWTAMSLTHSDGYVMFTMGGNIDHSHTYEIWPGHADEHAQGKRHSHQNSHYWYRFWEAPLGQPIGGDETKGQLHENREGLFIREFTNGWAVYNRSGREQHIQLPEKVDGWASGVKNKLWHTLPDLDGEIYLKVESQLETPLTADVNGDNVVDGRDLAIVANALGEASPDLNDGPDDPLGQPVGGDETNGWAVYNRSGTAQESGFPQAVSGWASGVENQRRHTLADLDGKIYLKAESRLETPLRADVNRDGIVNILDLVIVANAFGKAAPDVNGNGTGMAR